MNNKSVEKKISPALNQLSRFESDFKMYDFESKFRVLQEKNSQNEEVVENHQRRIEKEMTEIQKNLKKIEEFVDGIIGLQDSIGQDLQNIENKFKRTPKIYGKDEICHQNSFGDILVKPRICERFLNDTLKIIEKKSDNHQFSKDPVYIEDIISDLEQKIVIGI